MKDLLKSGIVIIILVGVFYILYLRECKPLPPCPAKNEIIISKKTWDSIQALADKPPEIRVDTFWRKGKTVYVSSAPLPEPKPELTDSTINNYADSLVNREINVWIDLKVQGTLIDRRWRYIPITREILVEKTVFVPKIVENPVPVPQRGFYGYGIVGGNRDSFLFGGGLDYITKQSTEVGYMYQRLGNEDFHSIKLGGRIRIR